VVPPERTPEQLAWAAGLFEGEGCFALINVKRVRKSYQYIKMGMQMTDEDVVRRFHEVVGVGKVNGPYNQKTYPGSKPFWNWHLSGRVKVEPLAQQFLPWLGLRRTARLAEILGDEDVR
jgi:hypothetical protein